MNDKNRNKRDLMGFTIYKTGSLHLTKLFGFGVFIVLILSTYTDRNFGMRMAGGIHFDVAKYIALRMKVSYTLLELFTSNMLCDHLSLEVEGMYKIQ